MIARKLPVRRFRRVAGGWAETTRTSQYVLVVGNDGWHTAIARGDRAEIERIYRSMNPTVAGLRIEAA